MKVIQLQRSNIKQQLFTYPCETTKGNYMEGRKAWILNPCPENNDLLKRIAKAGVSLKVCQDANGFDGLETPEIAIVFPANVTKDEQENEKGYYKIMYHYIHFAQTMVAKMKVEQNRFCHLLFVLPQGSNECSCEFEGMAYYALTGLAQGLGLMYAPECIFVNALVLNKDVSDDVTANWIEYLVSNNSNNVVGQVIAL